MMHDLFDAIKKSIQDTTEKLIEEFKSKTSAIEDFNKNLPMIEYVEQDSLKAVTSLDPNITAAITSGERLGVLEERKKRRRSN